ncbi:MAG: copper resistance protein CopC [Candidatus Sericytochromatia bacterium]
MRFAVALAGLLVAAALVAAPAASAHAARIATDPAEAAQLTAGPAGVSATFNEPLQSEFASMTVVGPDGNLWQTGDPRVVGAVISVDVRPLGPPGRYTVNYRVTSADGHPVTGSWWFELTAPGTGTPGPPVASRPREGGVPAWPFAAAAAAAVALAAVWALRRRG